MSKRYFTGVYQIRNAITGKRYVGSAGDIFLRWRQHRTRLRRNNHPNEHLQYAWNKYGEANFEFAILILCTVEQCLMNEQSCIDAFESANNNFGYNKSPTAGSSRGTKLNAIARANIARASTGRRHTPETRARISAAHTGKTLSQESRAKIGASRRGRKHSLESRAKISAAKRGKKLSERQCAAMSAVRIGKKRPPEIGAKVANALRGRKASPETRAKMSASRRAFIAKNTKAIQAMLLF